MRRAIGHIITVGLLACGGVVVSYAVAWGLTFGEWEETEKFQTVEHGGGWCTTGKVCSTGFDGASSDYYPSSHSHLVYSQEPQPVASIPWWAPWSESAPSEQRCEVRSPEPIYAIAVGWPVRCARVHFDIEPLSLGRGQQPAWHSTIPPLTIQTMSLRQPMSVHGLIILPLEPIWQGLLVNSLLYGSMLWLMVRGGGMIRRAVRRRRCLCVKCGYDLRGAARGDGSAPCPECGGVSR